MTLTNSPIRKNKWMWTVSTLIALAAAGGGIVALYDRFISPPEQSATTEPRKIANATCTNATIQAFLVASQRGNKKLVDELIKCGVDINAYTKWEVNMDGYPTELLSNALLPAVWNNHLDVVGILISNGINVNAVDEWGFTALMAAAEQGYEDIANELVQAGADVNKKTACDSCEEETALTIAIEYRHVEIVKLLLAAGAKTYLRRKDGLTAKQIAEKLKYEEIVKLIKNVER